MMIDSKAGIQNLMFSILVKVDLHCIASIVQIFTYGHELNCVYKRLRCDGVWSQSLWLKVLLLPAKRDGEAGDSISGAC